MPTSSVLGKCSILSQMSRAEYGFVLKNTKKSFFLHVCCVMVLYVFCVVLCVSFCTGHFVMVPLNLTYLHCLQQSFFEHLFNLYLLKRHILLYKITFSVVRHLHAPLSQYRYLPNVRL